MLQCLISFASTGIIEINSSPSGAKVYIDDIYVGITPYNNPEVPTGTHVIKVVLSENFPAQTERVTIDNITPVQKMFTFTSSKGKFSAIEQSTSVQKFKGNMQIASIPSGLLVFIDGEKLKTTPIGYKDVAVGEYEVSFEFNGKLYKKQVSVSKDKTTKVIFNGKNSEITSSIVSSLANPLYFILVDSLFADSWYEQKCDLRLAINRDSQTAEGYIYITLRRDHWLNVTGKVTHIENGVRLEVQNQLKQNVGYLDLVGPIGQTIMKNKEFPSPSYTKKDWKCFLYLKNQTYNLSVNTGKIDGVIYGASNFNILMWDESTYDKIWERNVEAFKNQKIQH